jgi:hypothetical protein
LRALLILLFIQTGKKANFSLICNEVIIHELIRPH